MTDPTPDRAPEYRDRLAAPSLPDGERQIALFAPDRARYIRDHLAMAGWGGVAVVVVMWLIGRADHLWAGILGVLAALTLRGLWFYADAMRARWLLTDRAVIAPGNDRFELADITTVRNLMGDVQIVTRGGRKHLIKHQADAANTAAMIRGAQ
ncbi:hypothetical protein [Paracoccus sp. (in: a-proteobacteria)]|uniref:hypothetical protein n=1 Tax=Paracoccus sp. TaxID=267 RepID=UPI0026E08893|nr:hypothetical protein [Paracoccus sp. (in: a-proteobacteria)]MDO5648476.1 hypothetical protein [Paracoccus sp. (in: a-proteobacteria)]